MVHRLYRNESLTIPSVRLSNLNWILSTLLWLCVHVLSRRNPFTLRGVCGLFWESNQKYSDYFKYNPFPAISVYLFVFYSCVDWGEGHVFYLTEWRIKKCYFNEWVQKLKAFSGKLAWTLNLLRFSYCDVKKKKNNMEKYNLTNKHAQTTTRHCAP